MKVSISTIYKATWQKLQGRWTRAVVACLVYTLASFLITFLIASACIGYIEGLGAREAMDMLMADDVRLDELVETYCVLAYLITGVLIVPMTYGVARFFLNYYDEEKATISMFFSPMLSGRIWSAMILRYGAIFLYTLLLIVPGVMKLYSYALTDYLLAEDQSMTGLEAMRESERLMKGHRWELFKLDLLLIPCFILSGFTFDILDLWLVPYYHTMQVCFYRNVLMGMDEEEIRS